MVGRAIKKNSNKYGDVFFVLFLFKFKAFLITFRDRIDVLCSIQFIYKIFFLKSLKTDFIKPAETL